MAPTPLNERARDRLLALLADDRPDAPILSARLRELGSLGDVAAFSAALSLLARIDLAEPEAERVFAGVLRHRAELQRALRRDPGIRVAALDFLSNVERRLTNTEIVACSLSERTERAAATDPITGLAQRRFFEAAIEQELRRSRRHRRSFSVILVHLDHLGQVNEAYGHLFGDVVLERAARIVARSIREADRAYRFGGDELAVVLPETLRTGAVAVAERIRARVEATFASRPTHGHTIHLTVSGGISCHPEDAQTPDTLLARAQAALSLAKNGGRNRVACHHAERRTSPRHEVKRSTLARIDRDAGGAPPAAIAVNLSRGGILLATGGTFRAADPVRVFLESADSPSETRRRVLGRVVRVERDPCGATVTGIGVAFDAPLPEGLLRAHVAEGMPETRGGDGSRP